MEQLIAKLGTETVVGLFAIVVLFGVYRLALAAWAVIDRRAGEFIAVQKQQADAITELATDLKTGFDDQRENQLTMRMISRQLDEQRSEFKEVVKVVKGLAANGSSDVGRHTET